MERKVKRVKRKRIRKSLIVLLFSLLIFIGARTFVGAINFRLSIDYQKNQAKILELTKETQTLQLDVQNLSNYDRIKSLIENSGLTPNQNSVINVGLKQ